MPFNRTSSRVALGLFVLLLAAPSYGQGPLGLQLFAPADVSTMGGDIEPNEGYFAQADFLWWNISQGKSRTVGYPGLTNDVELGIFPDDVRVDTSTLDTSQFMSNFAAGVRYEFGRVEDGNGWFASLYQPLRTSDQEFVPTANFVFQDQPSGPFGLQHLVGVIDPNGDTELRPLPAYAQSITMVHSVDTWSVELMYLHRFRTFHDGSTFEFFAGPRYMEFNDHFDVALGTPFATTTAVDYLEGSTWSTSVGNHVVGAELGGRWFKKQGRWSLSTEGRFLAGMNVQNIHEVVNWGPNLNPGITATTPTDSLPRTGEAAAGAEFSPWLMGGSTNTYNATSEFFSPGIELRLEARYQLTRAISAHAGWTGMWIGNIGRGDAVIDYTLHSNGQVFGIDLSRNKENVFINGLTLGFDINR